MSPPIRDGSGSSIGSIRLGDGTEISEVRTGAGDVLFSAIPDSVVAQVDATQLSGFSNGDTVSDRPDQSGNISDLTGEGTYRPSAANGFASVEYDGSNDGHTVSSTRTYQQKYVIISVIKQPVNNNNNHMIAASASNQNVDFHVDDSTANDFVANAGSFTQSGTVPTTNLDVATAVFDGANSKMRLNGSDIKTGSTFGTNNMTLLSVGENTINGGNFTGQIPFVEVHDGDVTGGLASRESSVASKFGLTL